MGTGSSLSLADASVDLGCSDLVVSGTLNADTATVARAVDVTISSGGTLHGGSGTLEVTGDWTRVGSFDAATGQVRFVDGCGTTSSALSGATSFYDLALQSGTGKQVLFTAGETTTVTGTLTLAGASGNRLEVRSTVEGSEAFLDLDQPASGSFVDVRDNHAVDQPVTLDSNSLISGNTSGWSVPSTFVPVLSLLGLAALVGFLSLTGLRSLIRRTRAGT